jgi:hypothetical protein
MMDTILLVGEGITVAVLVGANSRNGEVGVTVGVAVEFEGAVLTTGARVGRKVGVGAAWRVNGKLQAADSMVKIAAKKRKYFSFMGNCRFLVVSHRPLYENIM